MATQILTRKQKGDKIASKDIEQINSKSFFVKSQTGKSGYSVIKAGQSWECDCPDFRFHHSTCKHIWAVLNYLEEQRITGQYRLGLW